MQQGYEEQIVQAPKKRGPRCLNSVAACRCRDDANLRNVSHGQFAGAARRRLRNVESEDALGGRGLDNYSWHTDLPPGHPMVTGQQTVEFDLHAVEQADVVSFGA